MKTKQANVKNFGALILGAILLISVSFQAGSPVYAAETIKLNFATLMPKHDIMSYGPQFIFQEVEKRTGGKVKVTEYYSQSLGKAPEMLDMIESGVADIILFPTAVFPRVFMMCEANNLPGLISNSSTVTEVMYALYYKGLLDGDFKGYKLLLWEGTDPMCFCFVDKKVTKLEQLQKMKIRAPGGTASQVLEKLGCSVVNIPMADTYMALDRGVAEGAITMPGMYFNAKFNEVTKYFLWKPIGIGANVTIMTQAKWNSLPVDVRAVFSEVISEAKYKFLDEDKRRVPDVKAQFKKIGTEVYSLDPQEEARWSKIINAFIDEWIAEREAKGYPAQETVDYIRHVVKRFND